MSKKKEIYKDGEKFVFQNIIRRDFTPNAPQPKDPVKALKYHFENVVSPKPILEGLKREMNRSKEIASKHPDSTLLETLKEFEQDLNITIDAYNRSEFEFVAFKMFHLGRTLENLNFLPALRAADTHVRRGSKAGKKTAERTQKDLSDLKDKASSIITKNPKVRIGDICRQLSRHYGYTDQTIRKHLGDLHKENPFIPDSCFRKGRS